MRLHRAWRTALVAVSFLVLISATFMWCRSRAWLITDTLTRNEVDPASATRREFAILAENGYLMIITSRETFYDPAARAEEFGGFRGRGRRLAEWDYSSSPGNDQMRGIGPNLVPKVVPGLSVRHYPIGWGGRSRGRVISAHVTYVLLMVLALPAPLIAVFRWWRKHRSQPGLCAACGYDLRATPDRCPECGANPKPPHNPPMQRTGAAV